MRNNSGNRSELRGKQVGKNAKEVRKMSEIYGKIVGFLHGNKACPFIVPAGKCRVESREMSWQWKRNVITSQWLVTPEGLQALVVFWQALKILIDQKNNGKLYGISWAENSLFFFQSIFFLDWKFAFKTRCPPRKKIEIACRNEIFKFGANS